MDVTWKSILLLYLLETACGSPLSDATGTFWHISDFHLELYYKPEGETGMEVCPSSYSTAPIDPGTYEDYRCDSPLQLINSSINAMQSIDGQPDFILWTGDDTLHTSEEDRYLSEELVLQSVWNITNLLQKAFPSTIVFPSLGNHDYHPKHQMPPQPNFIVRGIADMWEQWMTEEQFVLFRETGYGSRLAPNSKLKIITLNTNMWDLSNEHINGEIDPDPVDQFQWFENELKMARNEDEKVYVTGHIGPGFFEMQASETYYFSRYNERYMELIKDYSDVIEGQFFGHHHTDSFRLFYDDDKQPIATLFYTPGVTPRIGVRDGSSNPGIRSFKYDRTTFKPLDYTQYYLDLAEANRLGSAVWGKEYTALEEFHLEDLSPASMCSVAQRLRSDRPCDSDLCDPLSFLQRFHLLNTVSYVQDVCGDACQRDHVCAIENVEAGSHDKCVLNWNNAAIAQRQTMCALLFGLTLACVFMRYFY